MRMWSTLGVSVLLLLPMVAGFLVIETFPGPQVEAADVDRISLKDQLNVVLRPRTDAERAYVLYVVGLVESDQLPLPIVNSAFTYTRGKKPYPFPYFRRVLPQIAAQAGYQIN